MDVKIKLKPYLKEYVECRYLPTFADPKNFLRVVVKPFLERIPKNYQYKPCSDSNAITLSVPLLSDTYIGDGKVYISDKNQAHIERIIYAHFKDALVAYVDDKVRYEVEIKKCLLQFCSDCQITFNDTNYETLKKMYYRSKKSDKNISFSVPKLSRALTFIF